MKQERKVFDTESFIVKAKDKFGDKFDYSRVEYKTAKTDVEIRCVKHDLWFKVQPYTHTNGKGSCPECRRESSGLYNKLSVEDFIRRSSDVHKGKYDYRLVDYRGVSEYVKIVCKEHGLFIQHAGRHLDGRGCQKCGKIKASLNNRTPLDDFKSACVDQHNNFYDYSLVEYETLRDKVKIICPIHGVFLQKASDHIYGKICKKCTNGGGYNPDTSGHFYILKVNDCCIKFGITKNIEVRLKTIRDYSVHDVTLMYSFKFEDGRIPPTIESDVKKLISCGILPKEEMYSGFTETTDIANLRIILNVVDKYKDQLS